MSRIKKMLVKIMFGDGDSVRVLRFSPLVFLLMALPTVMLTALVFKGAPIWLTLFRFLILLIGAITVSFLGGALYVQDIYELGSLKQGMGFLLGAIFGIKLPKIDINADTDNRWKESRIGLVGGPGFIKVAPGYIVVLEELKKPIHVLGSGNHSVGRFQYIRDAYCLEELGGKIGSVSAVSKDGLRVSVTDISYRIRFSFINKTNQDESNPYPFSTRAAINLSYYRSVGATGEVASWEKSIEGAIRSKISAYIRETSLEKLLSSRYEEVTPVQELHSLLNSPDMRNQIKNIGADLLLCEVGGFDFGDLDAGAHRIRRWSAEWDGETRLIHAQGEAEFLATQERGRAEGKVNLMQSVSRALNDVSSGRKEERKVEDNLRKIVLARTAQVIEAMTSIYEKKETRQSRDK
jgi:hypothetical protein